MPYRYLRNVIVFFVAVGLISVSLASHNRVAATNLQQADYTSRLDTFLLAQMETYKIPGLAIAIVRNGEVEYIDGYGIANPTGDPVTPDTPFLLASVSKSFTALGIMQLVEVGKIKLDDPVQKYLPWFDVNGEGESEITVADLVYQTSGFSEYDGNEMSLRPNTPDGLEIGVRGLSQIKLDFKPGEDWGYSNINYSVLGLLIQEVSGQRYEDYIEQSIFLPLEMTNSHTSLESARARDAARGYYPLFRIPLMLDESMLYTTATLPAFGLWSSAADMSRYLIAHLDEESAFLISAEGMKQLHAPGVEIEPGYNYAMGWFHAPNLLDPEFLKTLNTDLEQHDDLQVLWHEGDWKGYKSIMLLLPGLDFGVIILMNTNDPVIASVYRDFAWDVSLIANGGDAYYFTPSENFVVRHSRPIFSGLALLLLGTLVWNLRQWNQPASKNKALGKWFSLLINLGLLSFIHLRLLPDNNTSVWGLYKRAPDLGTLAILVSLLSCVWIVVSVWMLRKAWSK